jgi:single-strand DNA-binding protein
MNLNKVFILGRLTDDPQLRTTPSGHQVATFSLATNRIWNRKNDGQRQVDVQYHNVVVWNRQAEIASQFLTKGSLVLIEGRLQTRTWQDRQGQNRRTTEIICERMQLGPRPGGGGEKTGGEKISEEPNKELPEINIDEGEIKPEDLPF